MFRPLFLLASLLTSSVLPAAEVEIPGTKVRFEVPEGFTPLEQHEIDIKFPSKSAPRYVLGNERRTTTVAYDLKAVPITAEALEEQLDAIGDSMGRVIPGFVSIRREIREINGAHWAYFEMGSSAIDTDIHNIVLMLPYEGQMVVLNFNATKADFAALEAALRSSVASIRIGGEG